MGRVLQIGFIGNPNCGKTTLFNAYTGARLKTANWPGVTVEKKEGFMSYKDDEFHLVDLPGIYSLTSYTMEEKLTREYILEDEVDVIIDIVDASVLERNLYLTLCLIELNKPVILALNMMDIVKERGIKIDSERLSCLLGIPVVPVSARKKTGLETLIHTASNYKKGQDQNVIRYSNNIENKIKKIIRILKSVDPSIENPRWHAVKLLEQDDSVIEKYGQYTGDIIEKNYENEIINQKYKFIESVIQKALENKESKAAFTDRIDRVLTHNIWGLPFFLGIMAVVFFFTFTIGDFLKGYLEVWIEQFGNATAYILTGMGVNEVIRSLVVDGIITGVGGILSFLPNIFILFLALAFLEDSGYMSRAAYVMDHIMGKIGLSGKAFIPMLLGFGCSVPAVMATRTLEHTNDRKRTLLVIPFMSCSAKLPVYVLFSKLFFGRYAMLAAYSMYMIGILLGILTAFVHSKLSGQKEQVSLLIELPEYKRPGANTVGIYVWEKIKDYLIKAGTTIFAASVIMWFLLNFNGQGMAEDMSMSFAAGLGRGLVPILSLAGLGNWQIAVMLISGLAAKEVVVTSFLVLFEITSLNTQASIASTIDLLRYLGIGPLNAYCLMIFTLLYTPCIATIATIKKETNSLMWTLGLMAFQLIMAWAVTAIVYQFGNALLQTNVWKFFLI